MNIYPLNYTNIIGIHNLTIKIYCPNCVEQMLILKSIYLCVWNDSNTMNREENTLAIKRDCNWNLN